MAVNPKRTPPPQPSESASSAKRNFPYSTDESGHTPRKLFINPPFASEPQTLLNPIDSNDAATQELQSIQPIDQSFGKSVLEPYSSAQYTNVQLLNIAKESIKDRSLNGSQALSVLQYLVGVTKYLNIEVIEVAVNAQLQHPDINDNIFLHHINLFILNGGLDQLIKNLPSLTNRAKQAHQGSGSTYFPNQRK